MALAQLPGRVHETERLDGLNVRSDVFARQSWDCHQSPWERHVGDGLQKTTGPRH